MLCFQKASSPLTKAQGRQPASSSKHLIVSLCLLTSLNTDHEGWVHTMRWLLLWGQRAEEEDNSARNYINNKQKQE